MSGPALHEAAYLLSLIAEGQGDRALATELALKAGTLAAATNPQAWLELARLYLEDQHNLLALAVLDRAHQADPAAIEPEWLRAFSCALPIYDAAAQITEMLQLYTKRCRTLLTRLQQLPPAQLQGHSYLIDIARGLFLGYNGADVREAQALAGQLFTLLMDADHPVPPLSPPPVRARRIIAIVSETFYYHSNMKLRRSWLRRIDRTKFDLRLYHVGDKVDFFTDEIRTLCDAFHYLPNDLAGAIAQLQQDQPDIIQYTNLGLNPLTVKLATRRLAPVQATTWGHPITSGIPAIDYYLSSDLMELPGAEDHYSEELVRLPGLSVVPEPIFTFLPPQTISRAAFGLNDSDTLYLCLQSLQKYLPQHDGIYAEIAAAVPTAKFVFIDSSYAGMSRLFRQRLESTFAARGLNAADYLRFLPSQDQPHYRALHQLADITLDSLGWSGANTSFEALELGGLLLTCGDPAVNRFMRGRHTAAILAQMQLPQLVAPTVEAYVSRAIVFGNDAKLRQSLRAEVRAQLPQLYADPGLGAALNAFYETASPRY